MTEKEFYDIQNYEDLVKKGISLDGLRNLCMSQLFIDEMEYKPINLTNSYKNAFRKNKKVKKLYIKIQKLKSKIAKIYGVTL